MPPSIESPDRAEVVRLAGEEATLPCVVRGHPRPDVNWRKGQVQIDFYSPVYDHTYSLEGSGSLFIPQVAVIDAGVYMCVVENAAGFVTKEIELTVYGKYSNLLVECDLIYASVVIVGYVVILNFIGFRFCRKARSFVFAPINMTMF